MVGAIVASILESLFTQLQLAICILVYDKKKIEQLHEHGITPEFQESRKYQQL